MFLIDYINEGYSIVVSSQAVKDKIAQKNPSNHVWLFTDDAIPGSKLLIDNFIKGSLLIEDLIKSRDRDEVVFAYFTVAFIIGPFEEYSILLNKKDDLNLDISDVSYDLNKEIPKLYIKGEEVGVVSMTRHYITKNVGLATNVVTFLYLDKSSDRQKILSIDLVNEEIFHQY